MKKYTKALMVMLAGTTLLSASAPQWGGIDEVQQGAPTRVVYSYNPLPINAPPPPIGYDAQYDSQYRVPMRQEMSVIPTTQDLLQRIEIQESLNCCGCTPEQAKIHKLGLLSGMIAGSGMYLFKILVG